jgi:chemotaxis protein methyltransferase CheR
LKLGVTEIRKINHTLKTKFNFDFSDYSFYYFKRQLESYLEKNSFHNLDDFTNFIQTNEQFEHILKEHILVPENEMFRDTTMWEYIQKNILPSLKNDLNPTVWFPEASTGEELHSFLILLYENKLLDHVNVLVSSSSSIHLKRLKAGLTRNKGYENNEINYKRFSSKYDFGSYFDFIDNKILIRKNLFEKTQFSESAIWQPMQVNGLKLVIFRNKMLYYSGNMQHKVLKNISNQMLPGGYLIIGTKENIQNHMIDINLDELNHFEKIYRKIKR